MCVGTVLVTWFRQETATQAAVLGRVGSLGVLAVSLVVTAASAVTSFATTLQTGGTSTAARLILRWLTALLGVLVGVIAVSVLANAGNSAEWVLALILLIGGAATLVVALHVGRSRPALAGRS